MKHFIISCFILMVCMINIHKAFSQLSDWTNYTNQNWIYEILNDGDYLWLATDGGLVKMDKSNGEMTLFNHVNAGLQDNHIVCLAKDKENNIWLGSKYNGVSCFDGNKAKVYNENNSGLRFNQFCTSILIDDDNNRWIGSLLYLNKFNGKTWESWTSPLSDMYSTIWLINSMKFDKDGVLWLGGNASDWSFAKFAGNEIQVLSDNGPVRGLEIDKDNNKWLATDHGLVKYDGMDFTPFDSDNSHLPYNDLMDIKKDNEGNLWMVGGKYLVKYDGTDFTIYTVPLTPGNNWVMCLEMDNDCIWLGTRKDGLIKFKDNLFERIPMPTSPLLSNNISFCSDVDSDNNVWIGTEHNLIKIDSDNHWNSLFEKKEDNEENRVLGVNCSPAGDVWVSLGRSDTCVLKISRNDTVAFTRENTSLFKALPTTIPSIFSDFVFDKKGNTWLASKAGLFNYDGEKWSYFSPDNSPLPDFQIISLAIDKNDNLWVGAGHQYGDGGLCKFDGQDWIVYNTLNSGLPTPLVTSMGFDSKNILWLHCRDEDNFIGKTRGSGLTRFDGKSWQSYNISNSKIPSNSILDIVVDKNDDLWLATYGRVGITKFDGTDWESYNTENSGIAWDEVSKITLDYNRDLIWLNHLNSGGISTAKLNWKGSGIEEKNIASSPSFSIYPNPARDIIHFRFPDGTIPEKLEIYDVSGKLIGSKKLKSMSCNLSELNIRQKGLYLLKATDSADQIYVNRLLVE